MVVNHGLNGERLNAAMLELTINYVGHHYYSYCMYIIYYSIMIVLYILQTTTSTLQSIINLIIKVWNLLYTIKNCDLLTISKLLLLIIKTYHMRFLFSVVGWFG